MAFNVSETPCPACGETAVRIHLAELPDGDCAVSCGECEREFSLAAIRDTVDKWAGVLAWLDKAPSDTQ